jgi:hypothetical protein
VGACPSFHVRAKADSLYETFSSPKNTIQWAKSRYPVILNAALFFSKHQTTIKVLNKVIKMTPLL